MCTQNPTLAFPTATNGSNNSDSDGGGLGSPGANYFFGFLITFVVLLLIFIGCGIGTRRRFVARRNAALLAGTAYEPWGPLSKDGSQFQTQPELYEKLVADPVVKDHWRETMPLSATYRRGSPEVNTQAILQGLYDHEMHPDHYEIENTPPLQDQQPRTPGQHLRAWIPCLSNTQQKEHEIEEAPETEKVESPPPEFLDVAVMIAMPTQPAARRLSSFHHETAEHYDEDSGGSPSNDHPPAQFHIGTVSLPLEWPVGLIVRPPPPSPAPFTASQ
ncbi:hypothetical protein D9619_007897 [Psilocybe cf. subviscida]|uniref:Uncharacterized protein n=1 Tax=Psilocybe cf. subviscida TaxID=2480587 RepID=A0A8H5ESF8_9AGAR|nr:hypothetical protein D9619_007897 [Psilocybe cf. subviscida]